MTRRGIRAECGRHLGRRFFAGCCFDFVVMIIRSSASRLHRVIFETRHRKRLSGRINGVTSSILRRRSVRVSGHDFLSGTGSVAFGFP